ncbi:MAG: hypothetical protein SFX73_20085 [Kofleriaceae bacterium]|nr:hypothetical protein [Kofleriaceae bacterium]
MIPARAALPFVACVLLAGLAWAACKQQEGERCQINDDCEDGLVCNKATQECAIRTSGDIDATIPIDAPDAATTDDASIDGPIDAPIDAMLDAPDAPPV